MAYSEQDKSLDDLEIITRFNQVKNENSIYNSSYIQDYLTPVYTKMGTDNRHTALVIDIRLRIGCLTDNNLVLKKGTNQPELIIKRCRIGKADAQSAVITLKQ